MAKIPVKKIAKFTKDNWKTIGVAGGAVIKAKNEFDDFISNVREHNENKKHPRKARYLEYQDILKNLHSKNRLELFHYTLEIEQFIEQIRSEQDMKINVKKPVHNKRINNWQSILTQIETRIRINDYQEYLRLYNDPDYNSEYFKGHEKLMDKYKKILNSGDQQELLQFLLNKTTNSEDKIKRDFLLD